MATTSGFAVHPALRQKPISSCRTKSALFCAGPWHLRHAPAQASVGAGRPAGQPPPHRARTGPGGFTLQNAAQIQSAYGRRAGADGGTKSAQPGVYSESTRYCLRWGYYLSPHGRRLAVSRRGTGSLLAGSRWVVDGQPYAGRVGEPGVSDGDLSAAARRGAHHAYRPWQSVWRRQLSAAPDASTACSPV